ncbi:response regulator [Lacibacter sp. H375]|uniref:response regulator n=1 Tax=Lacibacter sp. H375 TaxID=3133424 RepID=UPI0030BE5DB7
MMNVNTAFPLLPTDQFIPGTNKSNCCKKKFILFFADMLEKIKQFTDASAKETASGTLNVLIVDDDEDDRMLFEEAIFKIEPLIQVDQARNGMELVEKMKDGSLPEIIFLDLNMPGKTGKECLADIREHERWKKIPVVIYSTSANRNDINDTYKGGANLYMLKPSSFSELIRMIRKTFTYDWEHMQPLSQKDFVLTLTSAV